jgi:hypothetical protein
MHACRKNQTRRGHGTAGLTAEQPQFSQPAKNRRANRPQLLEGWQAGSRTGVTGAACTPNTAPWEFRGPPALGRAGLHGLPLTRELHGPQGHMGPQRRRDRRNRGADIGSVIMSSAQVGLAGHPRPSNAWYSARRASAQRAARCAPKKVARPRALAAGAPPSPAGCQQPPTFLLEGRRYWSCEPALSGAWCPGPYARCTCGWGMGLGVRGGEKVICHQGCLMEPTEQGMAGCRSRYTSL